MNNNVIGLSHISHSERKATIFRPVYCHYVSCCFLLYQISLKTFSLRRIIVEMIKACEKWDTWCFRIILVLFLASAGMNGYAAEQPNLKFDEADSFHENVAVVKVDGKWGLIDVDGHVVVPAQYDYIDDVSFYQGTMIVKNADKYGLINAAGKEIIPIKYEAITVTSWAGWPHNGLIAVQQGGKWGVYDRNGREIVPIQYDSASINDEETPVINVSRGKAEGLLDESGHEIIPCTSKYDGIIPSSKHDNIYNFTHNISPAKATKAKGSRVMKDDKWGVVDGDGKELIPVVYDQVRLGDTLILVEKAGKFGFMNYQGQEVIPLKYDAPRYAEEEMENDFSEGLAKVAVAGKWGYIDAQDRTVIPFVYDSATPFQEGLAVVERNQKAGVINKDNTMIVPLQYEHIDYIGEGLFNVCLGNKWGVLDKTNKVVIPISKDVSMTPNFGDEKIFVDLDFKVYIKNGDKLIPTKYNRIGSFAEGLAEAELNDKRGFIDEKGKLVIPVMYDYTGMFVNGLAPVKVNHKWGYINKQGEFTAWSYQ